MRTIFALALSASFAAAALAQVPVAPPMGWNSWDAYGFTISEAQFKANVEVLKTLEPYGWSYAVIDEGWYMGNPAGGNLKERQYQLDANGLLMPSIARYPSAAGGAGLKPLSDFVHAQGLKFGVHVVRGIPKDAVAANLPITGTSFRAQDAADTADTCPWDEGNFGVRDNAAGQAYYDSMVKRYADWGVDFIKIDCISDHPYKPTEIRQVSQAIKNSGRPMVLSLSPGPTNISHAAEVGALAQMWRIADDSWDGWDFKPAPWPNGVLTGFEKLAAWHSYAKPGNWPDADMLPFGSLTPHPGWGAPRQSRLTPDEARTMITLWAIARSPLILGGNLTKLDDFTKSLITNKELIAVNQTAWESHPVHYKQGDDFVTWEAFAGPRDKPIKYCAVFNLSDTAKFLHLLYPGVQTMRNLWDGQNYATKLDSEESRLDIGLPAHGSAIFRME